MCSIIYWKRSSQPCACTNHVRGHSLFCRTIQFRGRCIPSFGPWIRLHCCSSSNSNSNSNSNIPILTTMKEIYPNDNNDNDDEK